MNQTAEPLALLTRHQVEQRCAISRSEIYRRMDRGEFPRPVYVGRAARWRSDDLAEWINSRPRGPEHVGAS